MTIDRLILWTLCLFAAFFLVLLVAATQAWPAQTQLIPVKCGARGAIVEFLRQRYAERQVIIGIVNERTLIEIFRSEQGSFSVLASRVDGGACMIASGSQWQDIPPQALKPGESF